MLMSLNRPEPATMASVAGILAMDRTTVTAGLKTLEIRGLVRITLADGDRRSRLLSLTDEGRAVLASAVPIWESEHEEVEKLLGVGGTVDAKGLRKGLAALA